MSPRLPENVPSWAHDIIITCVIGPIVSAVIVAIRVWTRIVVTRNLGPDDYAAMMTLLFCIGFSVVLGVSTRFGMGLHLKDMTPELMNDHREWMYISSVMYLLSIFGYRLALLLMYLRLFGLSKPFRIATWIVLSFVTGYLFSNLLTLLFGCTPLEKYWKPDLPGHCIDLNKADYAYGSMNVGSDVLLFLLPLPMVWQLNLSRKEKFGLFLIFMSGLANCAMTTLRFALLVVNLNAPDPPWLDARTFLITVVEINTGLICGCTPILKPFFRHVFSSSKDRSLPSPRHPYQRYFAARSNSGGTGGAIIWMGGNVGHFSSPAGDDDRARYNYGDFIELERDESFISDRIVVHGMKE